LGSFYPFSRNHNERSSKSQEPYALGDLTLSAARNNLKLRYGLLKQIYTTFFSNKGVGMIWKPLFFAFPKAPMVFLEEYMDTEFMLGNDLLFVPLLEQGKNQRQAYFP
jgi:alpha-glucosidase (family GH31 glycosyl hydrolase)